ncbi:MAG: hypothetical protein IH903_03190 [Proteobacteria bacterium]|nr:hypothetical protein [Pseudomonadota bacterium]
MEMTAYVLLIIVAVMWLIAMIFGMIVAFPFGILGLLVIVGVGLLFIKVLKERLSNKEDEYYSKNVDQ